MTFDTRFLGGLGVLAAIVEAGSFNGAGETLGLTQSGVSRAVQRLEQQLRIRLFNRTSRAVVLTDEGRRFYDDVLPLLQQLETAVERMGGAKTTARGKLRVNADAHFSRLVLGSRIREFLAAHPEISVEIDVCEGLGDLVADGYDVALRFGQPVESTLVGRKLRDVRVITCAAPAYLAERGRPEHPRDLAKENHECILFRDPATGRAFPWEFHRGKKVLSIPASGRLLLNDAQTFLEACVAGAGVAQVFDWGVADLIRAKRLVNLFPDWSDEHWPLYVYYVSAKHSPAKVRAFVDFVVAVLAEPRARD